MKLRRRMGNFRQLHSTETDAIQLALALGGQRFYAQTHAITCWAELRCCWAECVASSPKYGHPFMYSERITSSNILWANYLIRFLKCGSYCYWFRSRSYGLTHTVHICIYNKLSRSHCRAWRKSIGSVSKKPIRPAEPVIPAPPQASSRAGGAGWWTWGWALAGRGWPGFGWAPDRAWVSYRTGMH